MKNLKNIIIWPIKTAFRLILNFAFGNIFSFKFFLSIFLIIFGIGFFIVYASVKNPSCTSGFCSLIPGLDELSEIANQQSQKEEIKPQASPSSQNATEEVLATRVIDGDTIEIEGGQKIRYIGIDTPESVDPEKPVECFALESSLKNKELVEGKMVKLEKDVSENDKYGRLLRYVYVDDIFVNDYLIRQGFAHATSYPPDVKYQDLLRGAQEEARERNLGLWASCPSGIYGYTTLGQKQTDCLIKGNISWSGEKIYHLPECSYYDRTVINETGGERWFCTEEEALAAGWRKAQNCP